MKPSVFVIETVPAPSKQPGIENHSEKLFIIADDIDLVKAWQKARRYLFGAPVEVTINSLGPVDLIIETKDFRSK